MKNKPFRTLLKAWITAASLGAFFFGWAVLGHSGKPATVLASDPISSSNTTSIDAQVTLLPTLAPLPAMGSSSPSLQPLVQQQAPATIFSQPRFRTRGS